MQTTFLARLFGRRRTLNLADPTVLMAEVSELQAAAGRALSKGNRRLKRRTASRLDSVIAQCEGFVALRDTTYAAVDRNMFMRSMCPPLNCSCRECCRCSRP